MDEELFRKLVKSCEDVNEQRESESVVEDALARVLRAAYLDVEIGREYRMNDRKESDVAADEKILRDALFRRD